MEPLMTFKMIIGLRSIVVNRFLTDLLLLSEYIVI